MKAIARLASTVTLLVGCHSQPAPPKAAPVSPIADAGTTATEEEERAQVEQHGTIGTYVSVPWGFSTNSYWIEGPEGLVAIDTQFLPSAAEDMIARAEAMTKKKFVLAIVLHANPDKFNGTSVFQKHGVRVT